MDAAFLNYHKEEEFSSLFLDSSEISGCLDEVHNHQYIWEWDDERELNGDIALIPSISHHLSNTTGDFSLISSSPPSNSDELHRIVSDWQNAVKLDNDVDDFTVDVTICTNRANCRNEHKFDLTEYINDIDDRQRLQNSAKVVQNSGKKIDVNAQRYVVRNDEEFESEDDAIDVETVSNSDQTSPLVLQATDVNTLLEQFEANETTNSEIKQKYIDLTPPIQIKEEITIIEHDIKLEPDENYYEFDNFTKKPAYLPPTPLDVATQNKNTKLDENTQNTSYTNVPTSNKETSRQILNALPTELIDRIRQNSKRKPITVIPAIIPTKKRSHNTQTQPEHANIQSDHTYCTKSDLKTNENKAANVSRKDSGFSSAEEDEQRAILRLQPKVKNADGTLMVSLLKSNTITQNNTKKKLNLEEYKKRRSQNTTGLKSSVKTESENTRRLKHQEMLMKMAYDVINNHTVETKNPPAIKEELKSAALRNIVKKTLVSIGTNTEESWGHVEQILEKTKVFPARSLISAIVETLPLIKIDAKYEHGEDKTILYIDANVRKPVLRSVCTQTNRTAIGSKQLQQRKVLDRRRVGCRSAGSSSSTSRSSSSSRSRSPSPNRRKHINQERVVEERRVIYVGRIDDGITREELRRRFIRFGQICNVSTHFRKEADNYGFVTFVNKEDAYRAVEFGNSDPSDRHYDLSFGGRRLFCQQKYSDLDRVDDTTIDTYYLYNSDCPVSLINTPQTHNHTQSSSIVSDTFDELLRAAQEKLQKKKQKDRQYVPL